MKLKKSRNLDKQALQPGCELTNTEIPNKNHR